MTPADQADLSADQVDSSADQAETSVDLSAPSLDLSLRTSVWYPPTSVSVDHLALWIASALYHPSVLLSAQV